MTIYYVDTNADAGGNGTTDALTGANCAWDTIADVNAASFSAGDSVLFKCGCTWREQLTVPSSGSAGLPITFGAYGSGAAPLILGSSNSLVWSQYSGSYSDWESGAVLDGGYWASQTIGSGSIAIEATTVKTGTYSCRFTKSAGGAVNQYVSRTGLSWTEMYLEFDIYFDSFTHAGADNLIRTRGAGDLFKVDFSDNEKMATQHRAAAGGWTSTEASTTVLSVDTWYHIKVYWKKGAADGAVTLWVDGNKEIDLSGIDTNYQTMASLNLGIFEFSAADACDVIYDNVYASNIDKAANNANLWTSTTGAYGDIGFVLLGTESQAHVGVKQALVGDVNADYEYFVNTSASNKVTLYAESTPTTYYGNIEVPTRENNILINAKNYITVQNLNAKYAAQHAYLAKDSVGIIFEDCSVSYIGGLAAPGVRSGNGFQIKGNSSSCIMRRLTASQVFNSAFAYELDGASAEVLHDCTIIDSTSDKSGGGIAINTHNGNGHELYNITIERNTLTNSGYGWSGTDNSEHGIGITTKEITTGTPCYLHDVTVQDNVITGFAWSGFQPYEGGPYYVRRNIISGGTAIYDTGAGGYAAAIQIGGGDVGESVDEHTGQYENNLIYNNAGYAVYVTNNTPASDHDVLGAVNLFNNTFYNNGTAATYSNLYVMNSNRVFLKNNIFWTDDAIILDLEDTTGVTADYNLYYRASGTFAKIAAAEYTIAQFADYKTDHTGQDTHSPTPADPLFINAAGSNFRLQSGSPAINKGIDVGLTSDYDGNPISGLPDIGAYEMTTAFQEGSYLIKLPNSEDFYIGSVTFTRQPYSEDYLGDNGERLVRQPNSEDYILYSASGTGVTCLRLPFSEDYDCGTFRLIRQPFSRDYLIYGE